MFARAKALKSLSSMIFAHHFHKTSVLQRFPTAAELRLQTMYLEAIGDQPTGKVVEFKKGDYAFGYGSAHFPATLFWKDGGNDNPVLENAANFKAVFPDEQQRDASPKRFTPTNKAGSCVYFAAKFHKSMRFKFREDARGLETSDGSVYVFNSSLNFVTPSGEVSTSIFDGPNFGKSP